jgi:hypothetical protein
MKHIQSLTIIPENIERIPKLLQADKHLDDCGITVTWELLAMLEPQLDQLVSVDAPFRHDGSEEHDQTYVHFHRLVGYGRDDFHPILSTQQAYDIAYDKFFWAPEARKSCQAATSEVDVNF